jgi:hypothetical protein
MGLRMGIPGFKEMGLLQFAEIVDQSQAGVVADQLPKAAARLDNREGSVRRPVCAEEKLGDSPLMSAASWSSDPSQSATTRPAFC